MSLNNLILKGVFLFAFLAAICPLCIAQTQTEKPEQFELPVINEQNTSNKRFNWTNYSPNKFVDHFQDENGNISLEPVLQLDDDTAVDEASKELLGSGFSWLPPIEGLEMDDSVSVKDLASIRRAVVETPQFGQKVDTPNFDQLLVKQRYFDFNEDEEDQKNKSERFRWGPAIGQMWIMQGVQHAYAIIFQEKTQRAIMNGPFIKDYFRSIKKIHGWDDGNKFFTNYIAHPMQGAISGFVYLQNHPKHRDQEFSFKKEYWDQRFKAFLWATFWSTNWELGPISQSSLGNVGLYGHMGFVDLVITPTVGTSLMITEEAIDHYFIKKVENKSFGIKLLTRMLFNPSRTMANLLRFKEPWYRDRSH